MKTRTLMAGVASFSLFFVPAAFAQQGTPGTQQEGVVEDRPSTTGSPSATQPAAQPPADQQSDKPQTAQPADQESEKAESSSQQAIPLATGKPTQQDTLISSNTIVGATVKNPQGEELGKIAELMLDPQTGTVKHVVLALSGGWLSEAKRVALPWETMKVGLGQEELVVEINKEQLQQAPRAQASP